MPIGALVTFGPSVSGLLAAGQHGTTFGGNPLACAAGLAVLDTIEKEGLLDPGDRASASGSPAACSRPATRSSPRCAAAGCYRAIVLTADVSAAVADRAHRAGFIVNPVQPDALRLTPPLVLTDAQVDAFVAALPALLDGPEASA